MSATSIQTNPDSLQGIMMMIPVKKLHDMCIGLLAWFTFTENLLITLPKQQHQLQPWLRMNKLQPDMLGKKKKLVSRPQTRKAFPWLRPVHQFHFIRTDLPQRFAILYMLTILIHSTKMMDVPIRNGMKRKQACTRRLLVKHKPAEFFTIIYKDIIFLQTGKSHLHAEPNNCTCSILLENSRCSLGW